MPDDRQIERLREVMAAFNGHDLDAIMSHFREDCVRRAARIRLLTREPGIAA